MATKGELLVEALMGLDQYVMLEAVQHLESKCVTDLHNVISKTNVLRALTSLVIQDKKFPIPK